MANNPGYSINFVFYVILCNICHAGVMYVGLSEKQFLPSHRPEKYNDLYLEVGVCVWVGWNHQGKTLKAVFCPGFQKGRVPSEKGTISAVNGRKRAQSPR